MRFYPMFIFGRFCSLSYMEGLDLPPNLGLTRPSLGPALLPKSGRSRDIMALTS